MNHLTVSIRLKKIRLVCGACGKFVAHLTPFQVADADRSPWKYRSFFCSDHPGAELVTDVSATEIAIEQEAKEE